jgi:imidazolonepropionase-like amidohydrolase
MIDELKRLHNIGMTNLEAIQSATINAAKFVDRGGCLGSIEIGKNADMFLVDGDPLNDLDALRNIRFVSKRGSWFRTKYDKLPDFWQGSSPVFNG